MKQNLEKLILKILGSKLLNSSYLEERLILRLSTMNLDDEGGGKLWNSLKFFKCSGSAESSCFWLWSLALVLKLFSSSSTSSFGTDVPNGEMDDVLLFFNDVVLVWHIRLGTYLHFLWGTISFT